MIVKRFIANSTFGDFGIIDFYSVFEVFVIMMINVSILLIILLANSTWQIHYSGPNISL